MSSFSHVDSAARPTMVDVGDKSVTKRTATAETRVRFPRAVAEALRGQQFNTPKGPVFQTAIIAGTMAAKRTHELIPFCHPLGIESCKLAIDMEGDDAIVRCTVSVHHKTGVEMEALTGRERRGVDDLRHVQSALARHRHRRNAAGRKARRQERYRLSLS